MNDKEPSSTRQNDKAAAEASGQELAELKRDMRTARLIEWARAHQQALIAAALGLVLAIVGASLWWEHAKSTREAAAMLYHRALAAQAEAERRTLFEQVVRDYKDTTYAALALMLLAANDEANADKHLKALLHHPRLSDELGWQASLDLAAWHLRHGSQEKARTLLSKPVGPHYEQLRHYLMAEAAPTQEEASAHLQQALAAISHDENLKRVIEQRLAAKAAGG